MDPALHNLPEIVLITTGGTIGMYANGSMMNGEELLKTIPDLNGIAKVRLEEFSSINSSYIIPQLWIQLSNRVTSLLEERQIQGIVITHGTDTIEETAFFLGLTVKSTKPVVLTGSMRTSEQPSWDGPSNLVNAVQVAIDPEMTGGTLVVMNETIYSPSTVIKLHNRRIDSFESSNGSVIGNVFSGQVIFSAEKHRQRDAQFDISGVKHLPEVDLVQDYTGIDQSVLDYHYKSGEGLVLQAFGGGRLSRGAQQWVDDLENPEKPVIIASSVPRGRISINPHQHKPVLFSPGLKGNKARILLMLSLATAKDSSEIQDLLNRF